MFYGFDSKRESGLFDKERVVFRPWQGGTYGGELDFPIREKSTGSAVHLENRKTDVFIYTIFSPIWNVMIFLPRSEVKFSDWTVRRLKGAHLLHKMTANAARQMRLMPSWEIL